MTNQRPIRTPLARSLAPAGLAVLALVAALIVSRFSNQAPAPAPVAGPDVAAPAAEIMAAPKAPPPAPAPAADAGEKVARPEVALLEGLPQVQVTRAPDSPLSDLKVSFKMDSRLTKSLYMGDRWLSPPKYLQVGAGEECTVEASIRGLNPKGKAVHTPATWRVADPDMVKLSPPGPGNTVKLTVVRPGQTTIEVASQGISKQLPLHARRYGQTLLVALAQQ